MKKNQKFAGLTGVALRGFFAGIRGKVIREKVTTVQLRPNGRVSPEHLIGWAKKNGFAVEDIPNVGIRIGVGH